MFSFGIFTTHLPYVIMVAFYAYFLFFGVEKASNKVVASESSLKIEVLSEDYNNPVSGEYNYHFENDHLFGKNTVFDDPVFANKLLPSGYVCPGLKTENFRYNLFSRPPPGA